MKDWRDWEAIWRKAIDDGEFGMTTQQFIEAIQSEARATGIREGLEDGFAEHQKRIEAYAACITDPNLKPAVDWFVKNCAGFVRMEKADD